VNGRPLASSETLTWLRENFRESPAQAKPQLDRLFVAGINHIIYHGSTYSPAEAAWPGWFFYAATQLNATNPLWQDFTAMHAYVTRVQSVLQAGKPDNDVLFYWPEADGQDDAAGLMRQQGMHENEWLVQSPAGRGALQMLEAGYSLDLISDEQIQALTVKAGWLVAPGGRYRLLVVPATGRMPLETLAALSKLRKAGAALRLDTLPEDVPGLGRLAERRARLRELLAAGDLQQAVARTADGLGAPPVRMESAAKQGLWFTRRARKDGFDYFLVNPRPKYFEGWLQLDTEGKHAQLLDPLTGDAGTAAVRADEHAKPAVYLQLDSGASLIVRTFSGRPPRMAAWRYLAPRSDAPQFGSWHLQFLSGGPELPEALSLDRLTSWTELPDARAASFSGTARYRTEFDAPAGDADDWRLDLGEVRETARVTLNGRFLGTVWSLPANIRVGSALKPGANVLEIEVTNLPANRIRDLDVRKVDWKIMKDINLASLRYRALDASAWRPEPSGLLGPVRLVPLKLVSPPGF
jgi:hypothetical protein